jgi:capsular polysaccharide biosynthesis protein
MEEMDLKHLFYILWSKKIFIIAITLISLITSFVVSYFILDKEYSTYTTLILGTPKNYENRQIEYQDVLLNQKLVTTYSEIAKSRLVVSEIINNLNLDATVGELSSNINVSLVSNTEVIKITVTGLDRNLITEIANEAARVFEIHVAEIMQIDNIKIIDEAIVPQNPIKPRIFLNTAIAGILGLMISVFIVFLLEVIDDTIKSPHEAEIISNLPILGLIPDFENEIQSMSKLRRKRK